MRLWVLPLFNTTLSSHSDLCAKVEDLQLDDFWQNFYVKKFLPPRKSAVTLPLHLTTKDAETQYILKICHQIQE